MKLNRHASPAVGFFAGAVLSCASVLSLGWPAVLHADDGKEAAAEKNAVEVPPGATRFGDVAASSELKTDDKKGKATVRLVAVNTSKREAFVTLAVALERYEVVPMARSGPEAETAWRHEAKLVLPAGERYERDFVLPPKVVREIMASRKKAKKPSKSNADQPTPVTVSYQAWVGPGDTDRAEG